MANFSHQRQPSVKLGGLQGFLPLSEDATFSTRGQNLPGLLQTHLRKDSSTSEVIRRGKTDVENGLNLSHQISTSSRTEENRLGLQSDQSALNPKHRSQRLIGDSNPKYRWEQYYKTESDLKTMKKPIREYYRRNNSLIQQYIYIDRLLDSALPHNLIQEYQSAKATSSEVNHSSEETPTDGTFHSRGISFAPAGSEDENASNSSAPVPRLKRTPRNLYRLPSESTPLLDNEAEQEHHDIGHALRPEPSSDDTREGARAVTLAIYVNLIANTILLIVKVVVTALTSSLSVLASLVDAALDWLSTAIVWTTNWLVSRQNQYEYPIGRRRLEPLGVLVFSVIMVTSFVQVALEGFSRLNSGDRRIVQLTVPAVVMMASTVVIKLLCWVWCRSVKNSSVQALAQDAKTDIVFNTFSIIFPLIGYFAKIWWFDPVGGIALSLFVIVSWSRTSVQHIRNLTGATASADERNVLLYLTMRFAKSIKQIQGLQAYHSGDKLVVEVDIVLDESMSLRDSHDLGESLQYVLESVPTVDRAFVHQDYASYNLPSHMQQDD